MLVLLEKQQQQQQQQQPVIAIVINFLTGIIFTWKRKLNVTIALFVRTPLLRPQGLHFESSYPAVCPE